MSALKMSLRKMHYLDRLGISDVYASPLFQARKGSGHGYDVTNPLQLNPELGPASSFDRFVRELQRAGLSLLLDMVPNVEKALASRRR